jgi:hypothetical protein
VEPELVIRPSEAATEEDRATYERLVAAFRDRGFEVRLEWPDDRLDRDPGFSHGSAVVVAELMGSIDQAVLGAAIGVFIEKGWTRLSDYMGRRRREPDDQAPSEPGPGLKVAALYGPNGEVLGEFVFPEDS